MFSFDTQRQISDLESISETQKEIIMATKAKENERMRNERIAGSDNGRTLRTRVIKNKKKYSRKKKHKKEEE